MMKTVLSKTGIEVLYPCSIHLLKNGEILECEYKSNHIGQDLLDYICHYQNIGEREYWGLKYVDSFEQRHWLDLDKLIRSQVRNVCPIHFHFRMKVYPPEPYKILDKETRNQIFLQLRYDLVGGRLCCGPNDTILLMALLLQYTYGDYKPEIHVSNYIKDTFVLDQNFMMETKAMEIHKQHLRGLNKNHIEDLFLRMASKLEAYGIDPYLVEAHDQSDLNLWVNHNGMVTYIDNKKVHHLKWMDINKVEQEANKLIVKMANDETVEFVCLTAAECNYIYRSVVDHLIYFTSSGKKSTCSLVGTELISMFQENVADDMTNRVTEVSTVSTESQADEAAGGGNLTEVLSVDKPKVSIQFRAIQCNNYYMFCILSLIILVGIISNWEMILENNYLGIQRLSEAGSFLLRNILSIKES